MSNLRSVSKEQYYNIIKTWAEQNGRSPTKDDFDNNNTLPSPRTLEECIKIPWNVALKELGLEQIKDKTYYKFLGNKELLEEFKKEYKRVKSQSEASFNKLRKENFPSSEYFKRRFKVKWNGLLKKCRLETKKEFYTKEEYLEIFKMVYNKLGRVPSTSELKKYGRCDTRAFINAFEAKNYNDLLKKINYNPLNVTPVEVKETNKELIQMYINFSNKLGRPATQDELNNSKEIYGGSVFMYRFTTMANLKKLAGFKSYRKERPTLYTKQEITDILVTLYKKYDRRLTTKELVQEIKKNKYPSLSTIQRHFKTSSIRKIWGEVEGQI